MIYTKTCKHCGVKFQTFKYNAAYCSDDCRKKVIAEKRRIKYYADHELSKKKGAEATRRRWARLHPHVDRYCPDCGAMLTDVRALRCKVCAERYHREYIRQRQAQKRAERRAMREAEMRLNPIPEKKVMDESSSRAKKASVQVMKNHADMERDARRKEKAEKKRLAASMDLFRKIYAKYQREKREEREFFNSIG